MKEVTKRKLSLKLNNKKLKINKTNFNFLRKSSHSIYKLVIKKIFYYSFLIVLFKINIYFFSNALRIYCNIKNIYKVFFIH